MASWEERFREGSYPNDPDPSPVLAAYVDAFPDGRALDVATGTGRNAVFLAEHGYEVDAVDRARSGLEIARENARDRGVDDAVTWVQADALGHEYPESTYDVVTVSFFRIVDRLTDLKAALTPGGVLFYQHHLRTTDDAEVGPSTDRYRFAANELLRANLDLTVLSYDERTEAVEEGRRSATAVLVARNSSGPRQSYPEIPRS